MDLIPNDMLKLFLAVMIGGLIGFEREFHDKAAGLRTIIFICLGATLFTIFSLKMGGERDPVRLAANIVSGVGFLGAGVILHDTGRVKGVTTAATIWLAAALGVGIGAGQYQLCWVATALIMVVLWLFPHMETAISRYREKRSGAPPT